MKSKKLGFKFRITCERKNKIKVIVIAGLIVMLSSFLGLNIADAKYSGQGGGGYHSCSGWKDIGLEGKFFKKVHMLKSNQEELGLSEKQMDAISNLKLALKRDLIHYGAQIDVLKLDIQAKLREKDVDVNDVNRLVDEKYEAKKAKSKRLVQAYADLKNVLTEDQYNRLKQLKRDRK